MRSLTERLALLLLAGGAACAPGKPDPPADPTGATLDGGGPPDAVRVDGRFDEWADATVLARDPADAPEAAIDLGEILALDDPRSLYLSLELGREVNAQSLPGALRLLVDTDADAATGGSLHGSAGIDLVLTTSYKANPDAARGFGFVIRTLGPDGLGEPLDAYPLDVLLAPTASASRFELRVSRHGSRDPALPALGPRVGLRAVYLEDGGARDWTDLAPYDFTTVADPALHRDVEATEARLAVREGAVRVAQMNVSSGSFTQNGADFARLLAALHPDVLLLDELPGGIDDAALTAFFERSELAALGAWRFVLGQRGGRQRSAVATRLGGLEPAPGFADARYREGMLDELRAAVPERFHAAVESERRRGISTAAGWIPVLGHDVLFVALDLQSTGWIDSAEDRLRVLQAATILDLARTALERRTERPARAPGGPTAVVGGDFNLVGSRTPLDVLAQILPSGEGASGVDAGASVGRGAAGMSGPLEPVDAERLGERTLTTWRSPGAPFAPGRLDYLLVPTRDVEVANAFVFTTEDLPAPVLDRLGLEADLSGRLSDHLVIVADIRAR